MKLTPISSAGGAIITEVDLKEILSANNQKKLKDALYKYGVLVIKDQEISDQDQFRFCEFMGGLGTRGKPLNRRKEDSDSEYAGTVHLVTNLTDQGKPLGSFGDGEVWFHHDGIFKEVPDAATVLYALAVTSTGGETVFANMHLAYDNLDSKIKAKLSGLSALNIYDYASRGRVDLNQDISQLNHWIHPLVIRHPETGKKALYVNPLMTARVEGISEFESNALLELLFKYQDNDDIIFEHKWDVGDLVIMDNRSISHARRDFPPGEPRMLRRTLVQGVSVNS